jgi:diguanylate cyclase (GGDEF)-like protein
LNPTDKMQVQAAEKETSSGGYPIAVLLVDDQMIVAQTLRRLLADRQDIELHYCPDPMKAVKQANEVRPTVILQDWIMPSVDGRDLLRIFRTNAATAETPIIVLSSEENPEIKSQAFAAGANDYLVKLPDKIELIARIGHHSKAYLNQQQRDEAFRSLRENREQLSKTNMALVSVNQRLEEAYAKLNYALRESERNAQEAIAMTELVDILQSCRTLDEAYNIAQGTLQRALPEASSGALCMTSSSRDVVEAVAAWGDPQSTEKAFLPDDCWALRRGKVHPGSESGSLRCKHVIGEGIGHCVCVPLAAQGETLGVLHLAAVAQPEHNLEAGDEPVKALSRRAGAVGERLSLALANLRLREVLRTQSIRDPLTGLFNRRYLEETFERELRRALRNKLRLALLLFDIDHLKNFNDLFGHQAGDVLLHGFGDFLNQRTRGQDVACRYGGEEFAVILVGASLEAAGMRAELLREHLKLMIVQHAGQVLGKITISIGISGFPDHGASVAQLVQAADQALYRAKKDGRDRVVLAAPSLVSEV